MRLVDSNEVLAIRCALEKTFGAYGFEFHPFKVAWYNSFVHPRFKLNFNEDRLAFLVVSTPRMFENAFIPFLQSKSDQLSGLKDPIDECMMYYLSQVKEMFHDNDVTVVHDFEFHPNKRPKIVMQTIAHISGAAFLYHPTFVTDHAWEEKVYGVCIHPKYGGWFALRAVVFFDDLSCPDLQKPLPYDVVPNNEDRVKLIDLYNYYWEDWQFRDIIPVAEKYSDMQIKYFSTPPGQRDEVIKSILNAVNGH